MASPSTANLPSSSRTREPPKRRSHSQLMEESGFEREDEVRSSMDYLIPRVEGAPDIRLSKSGKLPVPIPPIDSRVKENGDLVGYAAVVKFIDCNLGGR